ncbi:MAG: ABC transporter ATP-binding protein [Candidatus Izemoplasmataceae bacterium]
MSVLLKVNNLTKYYGDFLALDHVNLTINKNEVYGFIGQNGAGKTTTINIILSLLNKDDGDVIFLNNTIDHKDMKYKNQIGYVPDVPNFPSYLNAYEFLSFAYDCYDLDVSNKDTRIKEVLAEVGLENTKKKVSGYSRGMKQRLAIAQALIHKPILLIMDEPTSALDPLGRKEVIDIIRNLKSQMTVFYSTHILEDAQKVCDRIGLIDKGKIILEESIQTVIKERHAIGHYLEANITNSTLLELIQASTFTIDERLHETGIVYSLKKPAYHMSLLKYLIDKNVEILTLKKHEKTLEDVFIEVLHENNH